MVLIVLAAAELVSGVVDFFSGMPKTSIETAGIDLLDRVLLVLILVEIVHTVVLSLRAHHLVAQPFIIVGLVAVIRKILVDLSGTATVPTPELALLIAMIFVFVAALLAVTWFDRRRKGEPDLAEQEISYGLRAGVGCGRDRGLFSRREVRANCDAPAGAGCGDARCLPAVLIIHF